MHLIPFLGAFSKYWKSIIVEAQLRWRAHQSHLVADQFCETRHFANYPTQDAPFFAVYNVANRKLSCSLQLWISQRVVSTSNTASYRKALNLNFIVGWITATRINHLDIEPQFARVSL